MSKIKRQLRRHQKEYGKATKLIRRKTKTVFKTTVLGSEHKDNIHQKEWVLRD